MLWPLQKRSLDENTQIFITKVKLWETKIITSYH